MDINEHMNWLIKFYEKRNWYHYAPPIRLNYLTEEVGELSRAIRAIEFGRDHPGEREQTTKEKQANLIEELADVIDQTLIICSKYHIDPNVLFEASEKKLKARFHEE
ncbi:MazG-like family protein [Lentilactobacillus sp. Marseille-Q4993]|uniref:MazG-like family protein n=1 Tax=Lentilactobacillus sp. Marseille-Q4993 TaxID=3039492 RepID=UPI0024BC3A6A|nr:MazG-like family protein [Lentilactobacillus sp. Marseille-Q4993]